MELLPGEGLGLFKLGTTLWDTINLLRSTSARLLGNLTQSAITWSSEYPNASYIVINVHAGSEAAYRLVYAGTTQRLELIEALPPAIANSITWKGQTLFPASSSSLADGSAFLLNPQRALNSKFGPTYPPSPHPSFGNELVLTYPGVVFAFLKDGAIPSPASRIPVTNGGNANRGNQQASPLTRLVVSRHDPSVNHATAYPDIAKLEEMQAEHAVAEGDISYVDIQLGNNTAGPSKLTLHVISQPLSPPIESFEVILGQTTSEDLSCSLGPPLRVHYKEDDRLSIHGRAQGSASSSEIPPNAYFYNYFSLGLDFLLHPSTNKVIKVLIHANTPGEVLFGRYNKCRWRLRRAGNVGEVTSEDNLDKVRSFFSSSASEGTSQSKSRSSSRTERTMLLDRLADTTDGVKLDRTTGMLFFSNTNSTWLIQYGLLDLLAYPGCILEVTQNSSIETVWVV